MNTTVTQAPPATTPSNLPRPTSRTLRKRLTQLLRRGHLYLGLFLFPWAILYGVTAFLFNHPTAFSDQPTASFSRATLAGTSLEQLPSPQAVAEEVVRKLNETQATNTPYQLSGPAKFGGREFAFATVKAKGQTVNVLIDLKNGGGTVRSTPTREKKVPEQAPFAVGAASPPAGRGGRGTSGPPPGITSRNVGLKLDQSLSEQIKASVPTILERTGFPTGDVTVTSVPEVVFPIEAEGRLWTASYNPMSGSVSGTPADAKPESELSFRRFLLRLHMAHGYPGETNSKWFWALIVDAMAFTMCFWGLSGLVMWWQIKATRRIGFVILALSAIAATLLGFAMHSAMIA